MEKTSYLSENLIFIKFETNVKMYAEIANFIGYRTWKWNRDETIKKKNNLIVRERKTIQYTRNIKREIEGNRW